MVEKIESLIIGGGQAGLSLSYFLTRAGREHIVLEKASQVADAWRNRRWDKFMAVTPNWHFRLPGAEYAGTDPEGFMPKAEIVHRFERYERDNHLPVRCSTEVSRVERVEGPARYRTDAGDQVYESQNVVVATGMFHQVIFPPYASLIPPDIVQLTADAYRNSETLPPGAVLVIGSGQSGSQIADELNRAGRKVYLSTSGAGRMARRYRGKDAYDWLERIGYFDRTPSELKSPRERFAPPPSLSGKDGGRDLNLHQFSRDGIILLGRLRGYADGKLVVAPDLKENLSRADAFAADAIRQIDTYIQKASLDLPIGEVVILDDGFRAPVITSLDLVAEGIRTIIWATGFSMDYSLVKLPVLDADGFPMTDRGVTRYPGLYFLGMNWMNKFKSGFLFGIGESAQYVAEAIARD